MLAARGVLARPNAPATGFYLRDIAGNWAGPSFAVSEHMRARVQSPNELPPALQHQTFVSAPRASDDPMTLSQASYLMMLCEETGEVFDDSLSQAEAVDLIRVLEVATGRSRTSH